MLTLTDQNIPSPEPAMVANQEEAREFWLAVGTECVGCRAPSTVSEPGGVTFRTECVECVASPALWVGRGILVLSLPVPRASVPRTSCWRSHHPSCSWTIARGCCWCPHNRGVCSSTLRRGLSSRWERSPGRGELSLFCSSLCPLSLCPSIHPSLHNPVPDSILLSLTLSFCPTSVFSILCPSSALASLALASSQACVSRATSPCMHRGQGSACGRPTSTALCRPHSF